MAEDRLFKRFNTTMVNENTKEQGMSINCRVWEENDKSIA